MPRSSRDFDVIVIGSGIGGLAAAAALARRSHRVAVLEQHSQLGGLTQTFARGPYTFATGLHYIGGVGKAPGKANQFGRLLHWLTDGRLQFAALGSPYDVVRLPDLEFAVEAPREAYVARLKTTFPDETIAIDRYFAANDDALKAAMALFTARALPRPVAALWRLLHAGAIRRGLDTTTAQAAGSIRDRRLAAILTARWGDYGVVPARSPFAIHALVTSSYFGGAYYPVGGPGRFAETLGATVTAAGGSLRTGTTVSQIRVAQGRVTGVRLVGDELVHAPVVISAMGAHATATALPAGIAPAWRAAVMSLEASLSYISLYLGFKGDIRGHGASPANVWVYESHDVGRVWEHPTDEDAPAMYVSFPSLKDSAHPDPEHHTAEVVVICRWESFQAWADSKMAHRPEEYEAAKAWIAENLLAQFQRHFPRLAPLIDFHELSTPLSQASFLLADHGGMYGIEMSAARMASPALRMRTPVDGLFLAGQDAGSPGIEGAFMGGLLAAASADPRLWPELRR